jgi:hypothetical protein
MTRANKTPQFQPDIIAYQRSVPGGMVYELEHEQLGTLGRISNLSYGSGQTQISVETEGDPDDPLWEERVGHLNAIVRACFEEIGESRQLPSIEEAKANARLYRRFTGIQHSLEMWDFVRALSEQDYVCLLSMATHASQVARPAEAAGLQLRLALLQACRAARPEARPHPANGLYLSDGNRLVMLRKASGSGAGKQTRSRRRKR